MPVLILFIAMLALMLMRVYLPFGGAQRRGKEIKAVSLSLVERALLQRLNIYAIGIVLLLTTVTGLVATSFEFAIVMIALGILFLPVRYVMTSEGIAVNNVIFRPWSEFQGFAIERRRIVLEGKQGTRPLALSLLPGHQQDILTVLRRYLKPAARRSNASRRLISSPNAQS